MFDLLDLGRVETSKRNECFQVNVSRRNIHSLLCSGKEGDKDVCKETIHTTKDT